jgi:hypothetical protein
MVAALVCGDCAAADVFSVAPGSEPDRAGDLFMVSRGEPVRAFCLPCWSRRYAREEMAA